MTRPDGRNAHELRKLRITENYLETAEGSVLIEMGLTKVICAASIEDRVPPFLKDQNRGWITAEYAMLPRSTTVRTTRESSMGRVGGRTHEIQRLIGRAMRSVADLSLLGERTVWLDCDVIQADGGTRTASISGAFLALKMALRHAQERGIISRQPIADHIAAVSVGIVEGEPMLDLSYAEDSAAEVDMNVVMTGSGTFIEIQGTAETKPFDRAGLQKLLDLAETGIGEIVAAQKKVLGES